MHAEERPPESVELPPVWLLRRRCHYPLSGAGFGGDKCGAGLLLLLMLRDFMMPRTVAGPVVGRSVPERRGLPGGLFLTVCRLRDIVAVL